MNNIFNQKYTIDKLKRNQLNQHPSFLIWFTGLSGSGKSTIASALEVKLFEKGIRTYVLDGDNIRLGINNDLGFSLTDRSENIRRIAEVSKLMIDAGIVTIGAFISPLRSDRELVKEIVGKEIFIEIFINTPLIECEKRDTKGLYLKARKGEITNFTGISSPYEKPENPTVEINTLELSIDDAVEKIFNIIEQKLTL